MHLHSIVLLQIGMYRQSQIWHSCLVLSAVSDTNKGLIHQSFSSNSNWPYDWSSFVNPNYTPLTDANFQTAVNLWFSNQSHTLLTGTSGLEYFRCDRYVECI